MSNFKAKVFRFTGFVGLLYSTIASLAAQETKTFEAIGPKGYAISHTIRGGAYYIPAALFRKRESLKQNIQTLKQRVDAKQIDQAAFDEQMNALVEESNAIRLESEQAGEFVPYATLFAQTDVYDFELGKDGCVAIIADDVKLEGWDGPSIRCTVEKSILAKEQPVESEFDAVRIDHEMRANAELFGTPEADAQLSLQTFLKSDGGLALSEAARNWRIHFETRRMDWKRPYAALQNREVNLIKVDGLLANKGNRHLSYKVIADYDNQAIFGSEWARSTNVTIQIPNCSSVAVMGCLKGLAVHKVHANLVVTSDESKDRDYNGTWVIDQVHGNVIVKNVPVSRITNVHGNVEFTAIDVMRNSSTMHRDDIRELSASPAHGLELDVVKGDVSIQALDTNLQLSQLDGQIDVLNEFGSTYLELNDFADAGSIRIRSQSGEITLLGTPERFAMDQVRCITNCGTIRVEALRKQLQQVSFSDNGKSYTGFVTNSQNANSGIENVMAIAEMLEDLWQGKEIATGLTVHNRAGVTQFKIQD